MHACNCFIQCGARNFSSSPIPISRSFGVACSRPSCSWFSSHRPLNQRLLPSAPCLSLKRMRKLFKCFIYKCCIRSTAGTGRSCARVHSTGRALESGEPGGGGGRGGGGVFFFNPPPPPPTPPRRIDRSRSQRVRRGRGFSKQPAATAARADSEALAIGDEGGAMERLHTAQTQNASFDPVKRRK
jgi:hypothetical protein